MDPEKRIAELEAQVRELSAMVHQVLDAREGKKRPPSHPHDHHLFQELRARVDRVLRGETEAGIEAHIGAVWLSRTALVLLVGFLALGTRALVLTEALEAWQKLAVIHGVGGGLLVAGIYLWRHHDVFAEGFLGTGLGLLYIGVFSLLIPAPLRLSDLGTMGPVLLLACLAAMLGGAWWLRSQTLAVIAALSGFVTACWAAPGTPAALQYALFCCGVLALAAFLLQATRGWLLLSWVVVAGTHACLQLAIPRPEPLDYASLYLLDQAPDYSLFFMAVFVASYLFLLAATLADCCQTRYYRKSVATLSALNTLLFLRLAWPWAEHHLGPSAWVFWAALAAFWLCGAVAAERPGHVRNHVFPLFLAKGVAAATLALGLYVPREWFLGAMGLEGLAIAIAYKRSGIVFFKVLGLGLVVTATVVGLASVRESAVMTIAGHTVPRNLVAALGMGLTFSITAAFYERYVRWMRPEERTVSGQWFLADSMMNWRGASLAIGHAAAAAFVLVSVTIFQFGDDPRMPYFLAAQGLCFALLGLVLLTPQLEVGCIFLLLAAHLCYHVFLWSPLAGFEEQPHYLPLTVVLALLTYLGAYLWERYVRLFHAIGPEWEHHLLATGPYLAATAMLAVLIWRGLDPVYVPGALAGLALALLIVGWLTAFPGVKGSAVLAIAAGSAAVVRGLRHGDTPLCADPRFPVQLVAYLVACLSSERVVALTQRLADTPSKAEDHVRTLLVAVPVGVGVYAIVTCGPPHYAIAFLLMHGLSALMFGVIFRESRYRWGALLIFAFAIAWGATRFASLSPTYQALAFGLSAVVLLAASWLYAHMRSTKP